jgi:hypothetical protein
LVLNLQAQSPDYKRQLVRSFPVAGATTVEIVNKYGKVQVVNWDKDSVKFLVELRIRTKDEAKLKKLRQAIDVEFSEADRHITARTILGETGSDVFKEFVDIAGSYLTNSNTVTINYMVFIPLQCSLKIENKFGNVSVEGLNSSLNLVLSYGDFNGNRLGGRSDIRISSGDGEIGYMKEGSIAVSYGNLHILEAGRLTAETRSSNITIDKTTFLTLNSRRDKVYLNGNVSLTGQGYFSEINITGLSKDLNLICRYGLIKLDHIGKSFSQINIGSEFTDITLGFEPPASFGFELTHHQDVAFLYPKSIASLKTRELNPADKLLMTTGTFGQPGGEARLAIKAYKKCKLTIIYK